MVKRTIEHFQIEQICNSGQCFRMEKRDENVYSVIASRRYLEIEQNGKECLFFCREEEFESFWKKYFDLECDYRAYIEKVDSSDIYLKRAAEYGSGIRILRQDLWEMTASFLISQQNHIRRIRKCIGNLCTRYGEMREDTRGGCYYTFPGPEVLACLPEDALKECNLGYRSKYVVRSARSIVNGEIDFEGIPEMEYEAAKAELLKLYGVGEKVADCICLFGLHMLKAFPVDTHILQAEKRYYGGRFPRERYRGIEGVMQQYIFYWELEGLKEAKE